MKGSVDLMPFGWPVTWSYWSLGGRWWWPMMHSCFGAARIADVELLEVESTIFYCGGASELVVRLVFELLG